MQMTSQVAALDVPTATFMQRERRRLKVRHIWETVNIRWPLLSDRLFTKHLTGLQWDQLYTIVGNMKRKEDCYQGYDYRYVENQWKWTQEWFAQRRTSFSPPFMGLLLQFQKLDDMDAAAWEWIERQEDAWVQVWHAKQGVFRKKLPPDVRDDPMKSPPWENESWLWGTTSRKSTVESWEAYRVRFTPFCFSPSSLDAFVFFWVGFWVLFCLFCVLKHLELLHNYCKLTFQQTRSLDDRLCLELDRQWRKKKLLGLCLAYKARSLCFFCLLAAWLNENVVGAVALLKVCSLTECAVTRKLGVAVPIIVPTRAKRQNREHAC